MPFELVASPSYFGLKKATTASPAATAAGKSDFYQTILNSGNKSGPSSRAGSRANSRASSPVAKRRFSLKTQDGMLLPVHRN